MKIIIQSEHFSQKKIELPATLRELLNSDGFQRFQESKLGNDLFIDDPDRADRIHEAAEHGCDGSTHAEHIDDWREYLSYLRSEVCRESCKLDDKEEDAAEAIINAWHDSISAEIDACEKWHSENGSLENQGS